MLQIQVPMSESYDEERNEFVVHHVDLNLEHSLATLSKWESIFGKPFLSDKEKTPEEALAYFELMCVGSTSPREILQKLSEDNVKQINDYINGSHTATTIRELPGAPRSREIITAEIIYYWMIELGIPKEFEHWHLSRLFTQIRVVNQKKQPAKKMNRREALQQRAALNAQRKAQMNTRG
jgi:hypothetical protein